MNKGEGKLKRKSEEEESKEVEEKAEAYQIRKREGQKGEIEKTKILFLQGVVVSYLENQNIFKKKRKEKHARGIGAEESNY